LRLEDTISTESSNKGMMVDNLKMKLKAEHEAKIELQKMVNELLAQNQDNKNA